MLQGDCELLDALSFNFGNNILRGIREGAIPPNQAEVALKWFALNLFICREIGIGDHSIYTSLLIVDVIEEFGISTANLPVHLVDKMLSTVAGRVKFLNEKLITAKKHRNRLEISECLLRIGKITPSASLAADCFQEAKEIAGELYNNDLLC